jgi:branched-chain amino acid aminotransferase
MYLRPTHISMENTLGVKDASASQLYVVTGPTGTYFTSGFNPVALYCETEKIRSAPKGYGSYKMGR